jgi:hypothetical protein
MAVIAPWAFVLAVPDLTRSADYFREVLARVSRSVGGSIGLAVGRAHRRAHHVGTLPSRHATI